MDKSLIEIRHHTELLGIVHLDMILCLHIQSPECMLHYSYHSNRAGQLRSGNLVDILSIQNLHLDLDSTPKYSCMWLHD